MAEEHVLAAAASDSAPPDGGPPRPPEPGPGDDRGSAASGSALLVAAFGVVGLGNYAFSLALAHMLVPEAFGIVSLAQAFLLFGAWFTSAGFPWSAARRIAATDSVAEKAAVLRGALLGNLAVGSVLGLVVLCFHLTGALRLGSQSSAPILVAAVACSVLGLNASARGGLQGLFRFRVVALVNFLEVGTKLGVGVGLTKAGMGATGGALGILAGLVVATAVSLVQLRGLPLVRTRGFGGVDLLRETFPIFIGTAGMALLTFSDQLAVKVFSPEAVSNTATGLYQAAVTLGRLPYFFASALTTAVFAHVAAARGDRDTGRLYARKGFLYVMTLLTPLGLVMVLAPEDTLLTFLPAQYDEAEAALRLIAAGTVALSVAAYLVGVLQASGRGRAPALAVLGVVAAEAVALVVAVPVGAGRGTSGALIAAASCYALSSLASAVLLAVMVTRHFAWRPRLRGVVVWILACGAFAGVLLGLPHHARLQLLIAAPLATAAYVLVALCGLLAPGDVMTLRGAIPLMRRRRAPDRLEAGELIVTCHRGEPALRAAPSLWRELRDAGAGCEPFQDPAWSSSWFELYGHGREPLLLEIRDTAGVPVALVALQITTVPLLFTRRLEFLSGGPPSWRQWALDPEGLGSAYTNDIVSVPGRDAEAVSALGAWLAAAREEWDVLRFTNVRTTATLAGAFEGLTPGCRQRRVDQVRYSVDTTLGWTEYVATLSKRQRRHLRYEGNALERAAGGELRLEELRGDAAVAGMKEFIALHERRWAAAHKPGLHALEDALYLLLARRHTDTVVFRLVAGGRTVASQWGFDDGRRYVLYNVAFEPDLDRQSPANVLLEHVIRRCCDGPQVEVDLAGLGSASHWAVSEAPRAILVARRQGTGARLRGGSFAIAGRLILGAQRNRLGRRLRNAAAAVAGVIRRRGRRPAPLIAAPQPVVDGDAAEAGGEA